MPNPERLLVAFRRARTGSAVRDADLGSRLLEIVTQARTTYPELRIEDEVFLRALADRLGDEPSLEDLAALHSDDLFLACACGLGDRAAIDQFERRFLGPTLIGAIARITSNPAVVAEARQVLRVKLFVQDGERLPKILDYSGRGPLQAWVRTAAVRTALNLVSRQPADAARSEPVEPLLGVHDPATDYLKSQYRPEFERAFHAALETLSVEQRLYLRFHYVDRLTMAQIAGLRRVHGSTISRGLLAARDQLLAETRRALRAQLRIGEADVDSMIGEVVSRADITLSALFRTVPA
jgi:RNA polymerase sigma-70 factor (ECF subfamily)